MHFYHSPPPACDRDIVSWESYFGVMMPDDLNHLLRRSDGPVLWDAQYQKELQLFSAIDSVEYHKAYRFSEYLPNAIPLAMDGMSNFVVYRIQENKLSGIVGLHSGNLDWESAVELCDDLTTLIAMPANIEDKMQGR